MLYYSGNSWHFTDESSLETFVWGNLATLFGLSPLARQYSIRSEVCDILAVRDRKLYVLELKNTTDRYLVQQLTRYFDRLIRDQPFPDQVDYQKQIELIAIAPSFHEHNFIDRKYLNLSIQFMQFELIQRDEEFSLQIQNIDTEESTSYTFLFDPEGKPPEKKKNIRLTNLLKLHYWLSTKYAHKLGSELITDPDYRKYGWNKPPSINNGRTLKIEFSSSSFQIRGFKTATIRTPKSIPLFMILHWVGENVPDVDSIKAESGRTIWRWYKSNKLNPWTSDRIDKWIQDNQDDLRS